MRRLRWVTIAGLLVLLLGACAVDDEEDSEDTTDEDAAADEADLSGTTVTIFGPETGVELENFREAFAAFTEETGITVSIEGTRDFSELISVRVDGGDPPDLAVFPQPGRVLDFAGAGDLVALPDDVQETIKRDFDGYWAELVTFEDEVYGIPNKGDVKSLVWYRPGQFAENNYEVPETWAEMETLMDQMVADGQTPWCIGIGSGSATGWPFTDWVEDFMLRLHGPEVYDQWWRHEIPFDDPRVQETFEFVMDIWGNDDYVFGTTSDIATTDFGDAGLPLLQGDCMMHRQANFYANFFVDPERTGADPEIELGPDGDVDVFYLPTVSDEFGQVVLGAGTYITAFSDRPEVTEVARFLASTDYAEARTALGGTLSPNSAADLSVYPTELERSLAEILTSADPFRFDASDLMPGDIGAGAFWTGAVDVVTGEDVPGVLSRIENVWAGLE